MTDARVSRATRPVHPPSFRRRLSAGRRLTSGRPWAGGERPGRMHRAVTPESQHPRGQVRPFEPNNPIWGLFLETIRRNGRHTPIQEDAHCFNRDKQETGATPEQGAWEAGEQQRTQAGRPRGTSRDRPATVLTTGHRDQWRSPPAGKTRTGPWHWPCRRARSPCDAHVGQSCFGDAGVPRGGDAHLLVEAVRGQVEVVQWHEVVLQQPHEQHQVHAVCELQRDWVRPGSVHEPRGLRSCSGGEGGGFSADPPPPVRRQSAPRRRARCSGHRMGPCPCLQLEPRGWDHGLPSHEAHPSPLPWDGTGSMSGGRL